MAFRRKTTRPRKKAIWINIPFGAVAFSETSGRQLLLAPEDWEAQFTGLGSESAVLRAVVGEFHIVQTTAGTAGGDMFWGIYIDAPAATVVPTFTQSGMSNVTWLKTGSRPTSNVVTQSLTFATQMQPEISIKAKRKLTSGMAIFLVAQFGADAATPAGSIGGLFRFLVARD